MDEQILCKFLLFGLVGVYMSGGVSQEDTGTEPERNYFFFFVLFFFFFFREIL